MVIPVDKDLANLNQGISQLETVQGMAQQDYDSMMAQLEGALALMKANPNNYQDINLVYTQVCGPILSELLNPEGDKLGTLGASLQIGSALQNFYADMQEDSNTISNSAATPTQVSNAGQDLVQKLNDLIQVLNTKPDWLGPDTSAQLQSATTNIATMLGLPFPDSSMNASTLATMGSQVDTTISGWATNPVPNPPPNGQTPSPPNPNQKTNNQLLQDFLQDFTEANNEVTTENNATQAKTQTLSAQYNQIQSICEKGIMETPNFIASINRHMANG